MSLGVIHLRPDQHATYIVNNEFNYYVFLEQNSSVTFKSKVAGATIYIRRNIWGPGSMNIDCNVNMGSIGVAP